MKLVKNTDDKKDLKKVSDTEAENAIKTILSLFFFLILHFLI